MTIEATRFRMRACERPSMVENARSPGLLTVADDAGRRSLADMRRCRLEIGEVAGHALLRASVGRRVFGGTGAEHGA